MAAKGTQLRTGGVTPTQYAELKRLFLQAVDLPLPEREIFLREVAAVSPLANELFALLAQHQEDSVISRQKGNRIRGIGEPSSSVIRKQSWFRWLWQVAGPLLLLGNTLMVGGVLTLMLALRQVHFEQDTFQRQLVTYHQARQSDANDTFLRLYEQTNRLAVDGDCERLITDLIEADTVDDKAKFRRQLRDFLRSRGVLYFLLFDEKFRLCASSEQKYKTEEVMILPQTRQLLQASLTSNQREMVWLGGSRRLFLNDPFRDQARLVALVPVEHSSSRQRVAVLLTYDSLADITFAKRCFNDRIYGLGQSYLVDSDGQMLFSSTNYVRGIPFEDQPPAVGFRLRDPGVDLTKGIRPRTSADAWPLTHAAEQITKGTANSTQPATYRDFRGKEVCGIWSPLLLSSAWIVTEFDAHAQNPMPNWLFAGTSIPQFLAGLGCWIWGLSRLRSARRKLRDGKLRAGHYTLEDVIGYGGMGIVYRAGHDHLQRPFAVKMLDPTLSTPTLMERFEREVHLTAKLTHPNTIAVFDFGRTEDGGLFYAMEYLNGMPLSLLIHKTGPLPPARVAYLIKQVCASLAEAHSHGLLHRDIKPANIMACSLGGAGDVIKVLDFGLVKDIARLGTTEVSTLAGTPRYMAPERIWDSQLADVRSDIYSVGAVAYMLLTGKELFSDAQEGSIIYAVVNCQPPRPSTLSPYQIPKELDDLVIACLAKNPEERPSTIEEVHLKLEAIEFLDHWDRTSARLWWEKGNQPASVTETVKLADKKAETVVLKDGKKIDSSPPKS